MKRTKQRQLAAGIAKRGFRRWYERQLIDAHLWLVGCLVAMILVAAGVELATLGTGTAERLSDGALVLGGLAAGAYAFRRYSRTLMVAEFIGEQADCPGCGRHGFRVGGQAPNGPTGSAPPSHAHAATVIDELTAACPRCKCHWPVRLPAPGAEKPTT